jgi:hypothetical protein
MSTPRSLSHTHTLTHTHAQTHLSLSSLSLSRSLSLAHTHSLTHKHSLSLSLPPPSLSHPPSPSCMRVSISLLPCMFLYERVSCLTCCLFLFLRMVSLCFYANIFSLWHTHCTRAHTHTHTHTHTHNTHSLTHSLSHTHTHTQTPNTARKWQGGPLPQALLNIGGEFSSNLTVLAISHLTVLAISFPDSPLGLQEIARTVRWDT